MGDPIRRGWSIEAAAIAGTASAVRTVLAMIRLSLFPRLDLSDEELSQWFDDGRRQAWVIARTSSRSAS